VNWDGKCYVTDYRDNRVYEFSASTYTDDTAAIIREVDTRHVFHDLNRMTISEIALDVETGVGLGTGQGSDPQIMLSISRDGGHTFGNELWETLGAIGAYLKQVVWRRLGRGRDFVFRFRTSDPVKVVFVNASLKINE
jgi:hypothetical protein